MKQKALFIVALVGLLLAFIGGTLFYTTQQENQAKKIKEDENYIPLNIACVFSPPAQLIAKEGDQQSQIGRAHV